MSDHSVAVEYWTARFQEYDTQARAMLDRATQLITVGLTVLVTATAAFVAYARNEVLLAIPVAVMLLWAVGARMLHEHHYLAVYRDHAEQTLVDLVEADQKSRFAVWYRYGGQRIAAGFTNQVFFIILVVVSIALLAGPFVVVCLAQPDLLIASISEAVVVGVGVVLIALAAAGNYREVGESYAELEGEAK